jgi:hypothetical protein
MARGKRKPIDQDIALDLLLDHKAQFVRAFLEGHGIPTSGTKEELRDRLDQALGTGRVAVGDIIEHLDEIEGWGNQHLYLYRAPDGLLPTWRSETSVKAILRTAKKISLLNAHLPLAYPSEPTLSRIAWSPDRIRFVWITTRTWEERLEEDDERDGSKVWKAYEERVARGVLAFDWNLLSGEAMLMIERLPSGNDYGEARAVLARELKPFFDIGLFTSVEVGRAIQPIEKSAEVLNRALALRSQRGTKFSFPGRGGIRDAFERDPDAQRSRASLGDNVSGDAGNFYWKRSGPLTGDLHTTIYAKDNRVGIFGQRQEEEVAHVIQRIRHYCS